MKYLLLLTCSTHAKTKLRYYEFLVKDDILLDIIGQHSPTSVESVMSKNKICFGMPNSDTKSSLIILVACKLS